jgi:hypothetical protein
MAVTLPQYLVLNGSPIPQVGLDWASGLGAPNRETLQGKKVHGGKQLHGNQEKGCEEEKETLTVGETIPRQNPRIFTRSLPGEAPRGRLFEFSRQSSVASRQSPANSVRGGVPTLNQFIWPGPFPLSTVSK